MTRKPWHRGPGPARLRARGPALVAAGLALAAATPAHAFRFEFERLGIKGSLSNSASVGAQVRMEAPASDLIGKSDQNPGLCQANQCLGLIKNPAVNDTYTPQPGGRTFRRVDNPSAEQLQFNAAPGQFSNNTDDAEFNYGKHDLIAGAVKLTSDLLVQNDTYGGIFVRTLAFHDIVNTSFEETHPNRVVNGQSTARQTEYNRRPDNLERRVGSGIDLYDAYAFTSIPLTKERTLDVRVGNQLINWGESTLLAVNSINSINPPSENALFRPGSEIKEVFLPVPAVFASTQLIGTSSVEGFYQFRWRPVQTAVPGSFFSTSDIGVPGGNYAGLVFASHGDDPRQQERLLGPANVVQTLGLTNTSLTIARGPDRTPKNTGQYGVSVKFTSEALNNTNFGLFFINYHSRLPYASATATRRGCLRDANGAENPNATQLLTCLADTQNRNKQQRYANNTDFLPVDSGQLFLEYPENVRTLGVSFNTNVGDFAIQGEYAYRPNQPVQVSQIDVIAASLEPAFPRQDFNLPGSLVGAAVVPGNGMLTLPGLGTPIDLSNAAVVTSALNQAQATLAGILDPITGAAGIVVPGSQHAIPNMVEYRLRGNREVQEGQYVRGYERLKVGQFDAAATYVIGPGNFIGADQWIILGEAGFNNIFNKPPEDQVQFEGPGTFLSPLPGRIERNDAGVIFPAQQRDGYVTKFAWGYRVLQQIAYENAFFGYAVKPTIIFYHDVRGVSPGPAGNFVEGRKQVDLQLNFTKGPFKALLGYSWFFGGTVYNLRRDRDYAQAALRYEF